MPKRTSRDITPGMIWFAELVLAHAGIGDSDGTIIIRETIKELEELSRG